MSLNINRQLGRQSPGPRSEFLRVCLVEDDSRMCRYLEDCISNEYGLIVAGVWNTAESALKELPKIAPDVVVLDIGLPQMSGIELIIDLQSKLPNTAFLVLTMHDDPETVFESLLAGASGYILKQATALEIIESIRSASAGGVPLSPAVSRLIISSFLETGVMLKPKLPELTTREREILERLAKGKVAKEVADEMNISYETVRHYLKLVYRKLQVRSRTEAVLKYLQVSSQG